MVTKRQSAFTIMEVMIAIVIIGILATLVGPQVMKQWKKVKINQTKATMAAIKSGLQEYYTEMGSFPRDLIDLIEEPAGSGKRTAKWDGPYITGGESSLNDAWGTPLEYFSPPQKYKKEKQFKHYEIISLGPDLEESDDDIVIGE